MPIDTVIVVDEGGAADGSDSGATDGSTGEEVVDPDAGNATDGSDGSTSIIASDLPTRVPDDMWWTPAPTTEPMTTENYIITLELPGPTGDEPGVMKELGRVQLGKPQESFTAVRFFDNVAYAVTFERRDPLYVVDMSDPANMEVKGELDISGFSSYLHPMNADKTLILAIGEEADNNGTVVGLQLTVFNAVDPFNPFAAARYLIEDETETYSYSNALWDFKATRFAGDRLVMPVEVYDWNEVTQTDDGFRGFITFYVTESSIERECEIDYGVSDPTTATGDIAATSCYYCAYFPARSMIFDGQLMTMNDHFIRSTDMNTCQENWGLDIVIPSDDGYCCGAYF